MAKKKQKDKIQLSGQNIYTDKKNRTIYYDRLTKTGYIVEKKDENKMLFFKNRFVIILFAAILFAGTFLNWWQAAIVGVAMYVFVELMYRLRYFKKLTKVEDINFEKRMSMQKAILANKSKGRTLTLAILYAAFTVLVILNALDQQYETPLMVLSAGVAIIGVYFSLQHIVAYTKMK